MAHDGTAPTSRSTVRPSETGCTPASQAPARFRALLEQPFVAHCAVDLDGTFTDVNPAMCTLLDRTSAEMLGRHPRDFTHPDDDGSADAAMREVLRGDRPAARVHRVMCDRRGAAVSVQVAVVGVRDDDGALLGATAVLHDVTATRESERRRTEQAQFFAQISARANDLALIGDAEGRIIYASPSVGHVLGYSQEDLLGAVGWDFLHPDDVEATKAAYLSAVEGGGTATFSFRVRMPDGSWRWIEESATNLLDTAIGGMVCNLRDIHERVAAEQALVASEARYRAIADTAEEGIWAVSPEGVTMYANARMAELLGLELDELYTRAPRSLLDATQAAMVSERMDRRAVLGVERYELDYQHPDGGRRRFAVTASPLRAPDGSVLGSLGMVSDVTVARAMEDELRRAALHDSLTGLPNRTLALDRLEQALARCSGQVAVLFIDLDHFKLVNDSRGHPVGDALLIAVAERLRVAARPHDTVARFGGDEFVVICEDVDAEVAQQIAGDLLAALAGRFSIDQARVDVRASIGVAVSPPGSADDLLRYADTAMYSAKAAGRGRVRLFDRALAEQAEERYALAVQLRLALEQDELSVHYQPVVQLDTGRVLGVEALARWQHPTDGDISPARFVPVAELTGLAPDLDRWVMRRALAEVGQLRAGGTLSPTAYVAVNVSARNLGDLELEETIAAAAAQAGIAPEHVVLELTETAVMDDIALAIDVLGRLRTRGFQIAIDDFGTGHSSLAYLRNLPITSLKIDRSFIAGIGKDADSLAIVASIVDLAATVGLSVVAEGVETAEQAAVLRGLGCRAAQGWLWSRAEAAGTAEAARWRHGFTVPSPSATRVPAARPKRTPAGPEHGLDTLVELHREGASLATIAAALNQQGFRSPAGARWHRSAVARTISELAYPGLVGART